MQDLVQQKTEIAATITASATGSAWVAWLADLNEVLITVSTLVAITVGCWTLYDKWRHRNGNTRKQTPAKSESKPRK